MFSCKEYKSSLNEAINFYEKLCLDSSGLVHPIRQKEIEFLKQRINEMHTYPVLDIAIRSIVDDIAVPRYWYRLYIFITESRLKSLLKKVILHYQNVSIRYEIENNYISAQKKIEQIAHDQKMITEKMIADFRANIKTLSSMAELESVERDQGVSNCDSIFKYCDDNASIRSNPSRLK